MNVALQRARLASLLSSIGSLAFCVLCWDLIVRTGIVDRALLPLPGDVAVELFKLLQTESFRKDLEQTVIRSMLGLTLGTCIAVPLGAAMALSKPIRGFFEPLVKVTYTLPKTSLIPLFILWFGIGTVTNMLAVMLSTLLPVLVYTFHGVEGVPRVLLWSGRAMGTGPIGILFRIQLPAALPAILIGIRVALGFSFVVAIAAEMLASNYGIGKLIFMYGENGAYVPMFAAVTAIVIVAATADFLFARVSAYALRWSDTYTAQR
ncbi:ABC transporter permease [Xanthobacteraceae bacterium A53D]